MPTSRRPIRALALCLVTAAATPQTTPTPAPPVRKPATPKSAPAPFNPNIIFIDPGHGGADPGARLSEDSVEKDATLAFAKKLRDLLTARGFTVILTHESAAIPTPPPAPEPLEDGTIPPAPPFNPNANNPSADQRVEQANRSHAVACIILHASNGGHGVHLYTSSLTQAVAPDPAQDPTTRPIVPWDTAQAASISQSLRLATDLSTALIGIRVPLITAHASVRPIDSMTCPAIALEISPLTSGESQIPASDPPYQQRVAEAVATGLDSWRAHAQSQLAAAQAAKEASRPAGSKPTVPAAPKPKPKSIPQENPVSVTPDAASPAAPRKPAPIIRRNPDGTPGLPPQQPPAGAAR